MCQGTAVEEKRAYTSIVGISLLPLWLDTGIIGLKGHGSLKGTKSAWLLLANELVSCVRAEALGGNKLHRIRYMYMYYLSVSSGCSPV